MSKLVYYLIATGAILATAGGAYYFFTKLEVVTVQSPAVPMPPASAPVPAKPEHGDFQKRFQPKMPAPNGGT